MSNERRQIGHPYVVGGRRSGNDRRILTDERRMYPALNAARLLVAALSSAQAELSGPIIGLASILEAELDKLCSVQRKEEKIPEQWGIRVSNRGNEGPPCWYCKKAGKSILELFGSEKEAQQYIRSNPNIQKWKRAGVKYDARRYDEPQEEFKDDYMGGRIMPREELTGWVYALTLLIIGGLIVYFPVLDWVMTWRVY